MDKIKIKEIAKKLKVDELLVVESINKYRSSYGIDNTEMYAYIKGRKDESGMYAELEKQIPALLGLTKSLNILDAIEHVKILKHLLGTTEQQRREWADMCIRKQARIEELENLVKLIQKDKI